jgi:hypothetical protein
VGGVVSLADLLTETATVVSFTYGTDEYGNEERAVGTPVAWPARLEQLTTEEIVRDEDTVLADWRLFLPADAVIGAYDQVHARGIIFNVAGLPNEQRAPWGIHHKEVALKMTDDTVDDVYSG